MYSLQCFMNVDRDTLNLHRGLMNTYTAQGDLHVGTKFLTGCKNIPEHTTHTRLLL